jgi:hypothetical protein
VCQLAIKIANKNIINQRKGCSGRGDCMAGDYNILLMFIDFASAVVEKVDIIIVWPTPTASHFTVGPAFLAKFASFYHVAKKVQRR